MIHNSVCWFGHLIAGSNVSNLIPIWLAGNEKTQLSNIRQTQLSNIRQAEVSVVLEVKTSQLDL